MKTRDEQNGCSAGEVSQTIDFRIHKGTPDAEIKGFIETHQPKVLNIAGSRESKEPGIYEWVLEVLGRVISPLDG